MRAVLATKLAPTVQEALDHFQVSTVPRPTNPASYELIIKVEMAALNFFDGLILQGKYQQKFTPPFIPGSEFSGTVIAIGSKVSKFQPGDRVCGFPSAGKGVLCEYTVAPEQSLWKMPDNMTFEHGASFVCTYGTSYMALMQRAQIKPSMNVLVTAASGGVGTACVQIARAVGCKHIIGCVGSAYKQQVAKQCGCDVVINYKETPEWSKSLKQRKLGVDVFADIVGGESWNQGMKVMNWYGKAIVIGFAGGQIQKIKANRVLLKNIDVLGVAWGATAFRDMKSYRDSVSDALAMYERGKLDPVIGKVYESDLSGIKQSYLDLMGRKSVGKLLINVASKNRRARL